MGFRGLVVSDYTGDEELIAHGFAKDGRDAARLAFLAGVDMSMQSGLYLKHLPDLVEKGEVPLARWTRRCDACWRSRSRSGCSTIRSAASTRRAKSTTAHPEALALAREAGTRSIVMLRNEDNLLPLPRSGKKIALIGPFAGGGHDLIGPWNVYGTDREAVDLVTAVRETLPDATLDDGSDPARAVAAARAADIVVLAIGETQNMSGEAQSRTEITVPAEQQALAEAIAATGKPYVVLLRTGRALALSGAVAKAPALLVTWFLGSQDGPAIADILFGMASPPRGCQCPSRASGQVPYYYAHRNTGRPNPPGALQPYKAHFRGYPNSALFPFGHGLTYGDMAYSDLRLSSQTLGDAPLTIRATIANNGRMTATEVVQLYIHDVVASVTQPVRVLKAFTRVTLAPGARQDVTFTLTRADLSFIGRELTPTTEPGAFRLWVAPSAEVEGLGGTFTLT